jgi:hypothetical protein
VARLLFLLVSMLLTGCVRSPAQIGAQIPAGCYRFSDGQPFFTVHGSTGTFVARGTLTSFKIGDWRGKDRQDFDVTPAFVLHDGTVSAPRGPARMADVVTSIPSGKLRYERRRDGKDLLLVPVEAYGEVELFRADRCS